MNSAIYAGKVRHRRFAPQKHFFSYRLYFNWIDLDEVKNLFKIPFLMGCGKLPALIKFKRQKYMNPAVPCLKKTVKDRIEKDLGFRPAGRVCLLTTVQYFGLCYNPVSFYFVHDEKGEVVAVASEINNTPWNQRFTYCHDLRKKRKHQFTKEFHVSPFMPMAIDYTWYFYIKDELLLINMQNFENGHLVFDAHLKLKRQPFSTIAMLKNALLYPLVPFKIISGIYYHALRLKIKKIPFYQHPETDTNNNDQGALP